MLIVRANAAIERRVTNDFDFALSRQ